MNDDDKGQSGAQKEFNSNSSSVTFTAPLPFKVLQTDMNDDLKGHSGKASQGQGPPTMMNQKEINSSE